MLRPIFTLDLSVEKNYDYWNTITNALEETTHDAANDGQKAANDGQKAANDGQKAANDGQKAANDGQKQTDS